MQSKQVPYECYLIDEPEYQELIAKGEEKNISTLGIIAEFDGNFNLALLKLGSCYLKLNISRVANAFVWNKDVYYFIYGILKVKGT